MCLCVLKQFSASTHSPTRLSHPRLPLTLLQFFHFHPLYPDPLRPRPRIRNRHHFRDYVDDDDNDNDDIKCFIVIIITVVIAAIVTIVVVIDLASWLPLHHRQKAIIVINGFPLPLLVLSLIITIIIIRAYRHHNRQRNIIVISSFLLPLLVVLLLLSAHRRHHFTKQSNAISCCCRMLQRGRRVDGLTVIFDMDGVSSKMLWRPGNSLNTRPVTCSLHDL